MKDLGISFGNSFTSIDGKPVRRLYVIGNGFDLYHGAESDYMSFRSYLFKHSPRTVAWFDLLFGPRSLERSFVTPGGWLKCLHYIDSMPGKFKFDYPESTWSKSNLWCDFETNLCELNREKVFDLLDMQLPDIDEEDEEFDYAAYCFPFDEITDAVRNCTYEMKYRFHRWVNTLHYEKGFRSRMLSLDSDALFLNFNYTLFLESEYGIPSDRICYIHGNRRDKFGTLVLGHHSDEFEDFMRWKHKNRNRRRYRHLQKDSCGRYFLNDKLSYLTFFAEPGKNVNWRLPIRYYAAMDAEERLEQYFTVNYKNTKKIIDTNIGFFNSLSCVGKVTIIGSSLGTVDMDYFRQLRKSLRDDVAWEISYHSDEDLKKIMRFYKILGISDTHHSEFRL